MRDTSDRSYELGNCLDMHKSHKKERVHFFEADMKKYMGKTDDKGAILTPD